MLLLIPFDEDGALSNHYAPLRNHNKIYGVA